MKITIHLLFLVCIVLLGACSMPPTATPVDGLESVPSPLPAPSLTPIPMQTSPSDVPSTSTETVVVLPSDFSPVVYAERYDANTFFILLGGVSRDQWLSPEESAGRYPGEATYSLHTMAKEYKYFIQGRAPEISPPYQEYFIQTAVSLEERGMIGVLDGWDITKRDIIELSVEGEFYQQVVEDWLTVQGVDNPQLDVMQIFRVDIEGDGTDEVFISATRLDESQHTTHSGDYSIVLMRKVVGNDVITIPVVWDIYRSQEVEITFPCTYSLANFIDLNQDGVLEVVIDIQRWEGDGAAVYQIDGQNVIQALKTVCTF